MSLTLTRQLVFLMVGTIFVTTMVASIPAYLIIRKELNQQVEERIDEAARFGQTAFQHQVAQVDNQLALLSERPTLHRLMEQEDAARLDTYLEEFQNNTNLDILFLSREDGRVVAGSKLVGFQAILTPGKPRVIEVADGLIILITSRVSNDGYITGGIQLDASFLDYLVLSPGFEYRILFNGQHIPGNEKSDLNGNSGELEKAESPLDGTNYISAVAPLMGVENSHPLELEVLFPSSELERTENQAQLALFLSAGIIALTGALASGVYMRRSIRPLWSLVSVARRMGEGDLATPVAVDARTPEIRVLADTLEDSRGNLLKTLTDLAQERDWSQTLIQSIAEGILVIDSEGKIVFLNEGAARITGWQPHEASGRVIQEVLPPSGGTQGPCLRNIPEADSRSTIATSARSGRPITLAVTRARKTGEGQTTLVLHDVTEEANLRSLQAYFLANISHEFRTPLTGMKVSIDLLMENAHYVSLSERNQLLNSIYLAATSLQNLVDNLLESSKIESNQFRLRARPTHINSILAEACRIMHPLLNRRQQSLSLMEPLGIPLLKVDPVRLVQVVTNLLANASKYSPLATTIDIIVEHNNSQLKVAIADRGPGIPRQQREEVFRRFVRLEPPDDESSVDTEVSHSSTAYGIGLGLYVVKGIIEGHRGSIGVDDRDGGGSVFWFILPINGDAK